MNPDDLILVSIDDHAIEPPDMFDRHVPAKYADQAPKVVKVNGLEHWVFQDVAIGTFGMNAVVSWPKLEWGRDPCSFTEMRPGAYDVHERVRDMDRNGVLASLCFPTFPGFCSTNFNKMPDKALTNVMVSAYNDWHIDEWCAAYPGRFIPLALMPVWDMEAMLAEIKRVVAKGCRSISMPELPHLMGLPSYFDLDHWGPFFTLVSDENIVINAHIGQGLGSISMAPDAPVDNQMIMAAQVSTLAAQDLLWGGAYKNYPNLKVAYAEGGIGWISFYLDRCDRHFENQKWLRHDFGGKLPSEVFREHSLACFITDPSALFIRDRIGMDIIAWECDFPHSDAFWPNAPETVFKEMDDAGCTDEEMHKITWKNAARFYDYDPFVHIPKEQATVGALRANATDVDIEVRSRTEWAARYRAKAAQAS